MNNLLKYVIEQSTIGSIEKQTAIELLKRIKQEESNVTHDEIAVIGISVKAPLAENQDMFWQTIANGIDCIGPFPKSRRNDAEAFVRHAGMQGGEYLEAAYLDRVDTLDYSFFGISPKEANAIDPSQRLFLQSAWETIEDAGYGGSRITGSRTGVFVGINSFQANHYYQMITEIDPELAQMAMVGNIPAMIASRIAYLLDFRGPSMAIDTACSSSLIAVHQACQALRNQECDMALAGAVKIDLLPLSSLSVDLNIDSSDRRARSFDDSSDGTGSGEGIVSVLLKPLKMALRDGDHIYAVIKGSAINQDGASVGITAPNVLAQEDVILRAWKQAKIEPESIGYIEAHGTGTKLGDPIEIDGITRAFRRFTKKSQFCAIGSLKTNMGHLDNAAGIAGFVKAVLALYNKKLPPSLHFTTPNRNIPFENSPVYVNDILSDWETNGQPRRCGVSSFGMSGTNCHMVLEEAPTASPIATAIEWPQLYTLSAKSTAALAELIRRQQSFSRTLKENEIPDACYTANTGRWHHEYRIALVLSHPGEFQEALASLDADAVKKGDIATAGYGYAKQESQEATRKAVELLGKLSQSDKSERVEIYLQLAHLYMQGASIDWDVLYSSAEYKKIRLPVYPFEPKRCWIEIPEVKDEAEELRDSLFYELGWKEAAVDEASKQTIAGAVLILKDERKLGDQLARQLREMGNDVIEVSFGACFEKRTEHQFVLSAKEEDYRRLLEELDSRDIGHVFHMFGVTDHKSIQALSELELAQMRGVHSLFSLTKQLVAHSNVARKLGITVVAHNVHEVTGAESTLNPEYATLFGLAKVVQQEYPQLVSTCVDADEMVGVKELLLEATKEQTSKVVAYRRGKRYVEEFRRKDLSASADCDVTARENGVYLITGGTGGLGLEIAKYLAGQQSVKLALLGRSYLPEKDDWNSMLTRNDVCQKTIRKLTAIQEIERMGSEILYYQADVSKEADLQYVLEDLRTSFGRIDGIIHSAGLPGDGFIIRKEPEEFSAVLAPKVQGTWLLDKLTEKDQLDFFVLFSSGTSLFGSAGQADYTAANAYLDSFADYRRKQNKPVITINWTAWKETGMAFEAGNDENGIFVPLSTALAVDAFQKVMSKKISRVFIGSIRFDHVLLQQQVLPFALADELQIISSQKTAGSAVAEAAVAIEPALKQVKLAGRANNSYSQAEQKTANVWGEVLGYEEIEVTAGFYEIGGDSLHAMRVVNTFQMNYGITVEIGKVLECQTIEEFSAYLEAKEGKSSQSDSSRSIPPVPREEFYPASSVQGRIFLLSQFEGAQLAYHMPAAVELEGPLDKQAVAQAFQTIVNRHEAFRTSFEMRENIVVQRIHDEMLFQVDFFHTDEASLLEQINQYSQPFDLNRAPLLRVGLFELSVKKHVLFVDMHHIISDGESVNLMLREFCSLYQGQTLPELRVHYKDYAAWQKGNESSQIKKQHEAHWLQTFSGEIPVLQLPTDYSRPPILSYDGQVHEFYLPPDFENGLKELATSQGVSLYVLLLSAYYVLLSKYSGQEDIVIGSPVAGRLHKDTETMIGMFVNSLPLRSRPQGDKPFHQFVAEVRDQVLAGLQHQEYPFEELVEQVNVQRDISRNPLFDTMFIMHTIHTEELQLPGIAVTPYPIDATKAKYDITMMISDQDEGFRVSVEYALKLFKPETIHRMGAHFVQILKSIVTNPSVPIYKIQMLTETERHLLVEKTQYKGNTNNHDGMTVQQLLTLQAQKTPDRTAVVCNGEKVSYAELHQRAMKVAAMLQEKGVRPGSVVGLMTDRSVDMIVCLLGILHSGGCYLPLDPAFPAQRISFMLEDSNATLVLSQAPIIERFELPCEAVDIKMLSVQSETCEQNVVSKANGEDLAYVIYTSGSTGNPKGVMIEQRAFVHFIQAITEAIPLEQNRNILALTTISFDIFVLETLVPLTKGLQVVIADEQQQTDPFALSELIMEQQIELLQITPSRMSLLLSNEQCKEVLSQIKTILIGGEFLSETLLHQIQGLSKAQIYNVYGPTEATVWASVSDLTTADKVDIGKPIPGVSYYVVDRYDQLVPIGVSGELCIAGPGLAKGYVNQPELTSERFVSNLFGPGSMYRTGDLVKWLPNGHIEYLARVDNQMKIRGYRIEPSEIEAKILSFSKIKEAAVIDFTDNTGEKNLCAYYVQEQPFDVTELREYLSRHLPDYMIPVCFIIMDTLPLTMNGKLDRKALPKPTADSFTSREYTPPATQLEEQLVEIWQEVLGDTKLGVTDHFFEKGGHSLKAALMIGQVQKRLQIKVPISVIFQAPTIQEFAKQLEAIETGNCLSIQKSNEKTHYPVTPAQRRLYLLQELEAGSITYNLPSAYVLKDKLDAKKLEQALVKLTERHEMLRTSFDFRDGQPIQRVHPDVKIPLTIELVEKNEWNQQIQSFIRPFHLFKAPLMRVGLFRTKSEEDLLVFDIHHIIADGLSLQILMQDLFFLYHEEEMVIPDIQFTDFAVWYEGFLQSDDMKKQEDYWLKQYLDEIPILQLPTDYPRVAVQSFAGDRISFEISKSDRQLIEKLAKETGTTTYMVMLALYNILLAKYTGDERIIVGTPVSRRHHLELQKVIGMFVNTLAIKNEPAGNKTFYDFLNEVKESVLQAYENQDYPFESLIDQLQINRDLSRNPLFDTMLVMQSIDDQRLQKGTYGVTPYDFDFQVAKFDITMFVSEWNQDLSVTMEYCTELFKRESVERMYKHFLTILREAAEKPHQKLCEMEMLAGEELDEIIYRWNQTSIPYPKNQTVSFLFEKQVEQGPDRIALVHHDQELTYRELNDRANQLARVLQQAGVTKEVVVGILLDHSFELVISMLAVMKAGGAYLPLDTQYPREQINYLLEDSQAQLIITQANLANLTDFSGRLIMADDPALYEGDPSNPEKSADSDDLAYLIYTSGTTGKPKGTMITHQGLTNYICWAEKVYLEGEQLDFALYSSPAFDLTVTSIYTPLVSGNRIVIYSEENKATVIRKIVEDNQVDIVKLTPSHLHTLEGLDCSRSSIKKLIVGGEDLKAELATKTVQRFNGGVKIYNEYGPTETVVGCMIYVFNQERDSKGSVPIGVPADNVQIYLLDPYLQPVPVGSIGEMYISGEGVARGYYNRADLTAERFLSNPYIPEARMYKTGDLARRLLDGNLAYIGRTDGQVKIRGHRVELADVEAKLLEHPNISDAVVVVRTIAQGHNELCAYYVPDSEVAPAQIKQHLLQNAADYLVPAYIVRMDKLPLTVNGKVDKRKLPEPHTHLSSDTNLVLPRTEKEEILADIWRQVLGVETIGVHDSFFALGGDSIKAIQMNARLKERQLHLDVKDLFQRKTIAELAPLIKQKSGKSEQGIVTGQAPLTPIQHWFFAGERNDVHHYNHAIMLYRKEGFDPRMVEEVLAALLQHHDALRMVFTFEENQVIPYNRGMEEELFTFHVVELADDPDFAQKVEEHANRLQSSIELQTGPLVKVGLFKSVDGDHLLFVIHHLVVDGVSWRIILEDFAKAYQQIQKGEEITLPKKTDSFKQWAEQITAYNKNQRLKKEYAYWRKTVQTPVSSLPVDAVVHQNRIIDTKTQSFRLDPEKTDQLLRHIHQAYNTQVNDVLLAALGLAIKEWSGLDKILLDLEGHGREDILPEMDISRTVGWFTSIYPVLLSTERAEDLEYQIKFAKQSLRQIPKNGIGYGILRYGSEENEDESLDYTSPISFNYLGQFDQDMPEHLGQISPHYTGEAISKAYNRKHSLEFIGMVARGQFTLSLTYNSKEYQEETMLQLLTSLKKNVLSIIEHCMKKEETTVTPSDLGYSKMSIEGLSKLQNLLSRKL
ncbi:amino acid adenylation domain-containing protein [Brevibacillus laterosporus]|uniref:Amino acid adenylation domain-containing protein n=1 Tax=Brevibacillus halotolerans TaxID=1507437 RepID=A0ABT4HVZ4_9BACL|nr:MULTISPECIES: hybrid non-ribosomal peptide synthetase/type I polyketide synthase [Brevibacillus]MCR8984752.1 amino acid adenylation domain-containing protein [Brevibacillus laterosporus]MCZ0830477.1 amino acid adenylation domain-containing protein [Brevibacillus halotolerans]